VSHQGWDTPIWIRGLKTLDAKPIVSVYAYGNFPIATKVSDMAKQKQRMARLSGKNGEVGGLSFVHLAPVDRKAHSECIMNHQALEAAVSANGIRRVPQAKGGVRW
jgi:hypothetical protein